MPRIRFKQWPCPKPQFGIRRGGVSYEVDRDTLTITNVATGDTVARARDQAELDELAIDVLNGRTRPRP